jgi:hypothetical protein
MFYSIQSICQFVNFVKISLAFFCFYTFYAIMTGKKLFCFILDIDLFEFEFS